MSNREPAKSLYALETERRNAALDKTQRLERRAERSEAGLREALDLIEVVDRALERMIQSPANDAHWKGRIKEIRAVFSRHGRGVSDR